MYNLDHRIQQVCGTEKRTWGERSHGGHRTAFACGERTETGEGGRIWEQHPSPKSSWRESGKLETATGTKLKKEKGDGLNSIKT